MILSFRRRVALSVLLGTETAYLAFVIVTLLVPWDVTFSAFDGRPIGTLEAYVRAGPYVAVTLAAAAAVASLWVRGGRAGRRCVVTVGAVHAAAAAYFAVTLGVADVGVAMVAGYAAVLLALTWPTTTVQNALRSSTR